MADTLKKNLVQRHTDMAGYKRRAKCETDHWMRYRVLLTDRNINGFIPCHWSSFMKKENPGSCKQKDNKRAIWYLTHSGTLLHKLREKEKNEDIHQQRVESRTAKGIAASNTKSSSAWQNNTGRRNRKEKRRTITHTTIIRTLNTIIQESTSCYLRGKLEGQEKLRGVYLECVVFPNKTAESSPYPLADRLKIKLHRFGINFRLQRARCGNSTKWEVHYHKASMVDWLVKGYPPHYTRINEGHNNVTKQSAWTAMLLRERNVRFHVTLVQQHKNTLHWNSIAECFFSQSSLHSLHRRGDALLTVFTLRTPSIMEKIR